MRILAFKPAWSGPLTHLSSGSREAATQTRLGPLSIALAFPPPGMTCPRQRQASAQPPTKPFGPAPPQAGATAPS